VAVPAHEAADQCVRYRTHWSRPCAQIWVAVIVRSFDGNTKP
jgi:hypothetical protein